MQEESPEAIPTGVTKACSNGHWPELLHLTLVGALDQLLNWPRPHEPQFTEEWSSTMSHIIYETWRQALNKDYMGYIWYCQKTGKLRKCKPSLFQGCTLLKEQANQLLCYIWYCQKTGKLRKCKPSLFQGCTLLKEQANQLLCYIWYCQKTGKLRKCKPSLFQGCTLLKEQANQLLCQFNYTDISHTVTAFSLHRTTVSSFNIHSTSINPVQRNTFFYVYLITATSWSNVVEPEDLLNACSLCTHTLPN